MKNFSYESIMPGWTVEIPYYGELPNNYKMPDYIRLDIGYTIAKKTARGMRELSLGIYNVLNRHNVFALTYDTDRDTWQEVSLFPILPNFSWRTTF